MTSGGPAIASVHAAARRRGDTATRRRRCPPRRRASGSCSCPLASSSAAEITWTSMSPDARITFVITDPRIRCVQRDCRLAPSTICVAFSRVGELHERSGRVGARDLVVLATELGQQPPLVVERAALRPAQPVGRPHVHADELAVRSRRHARRPPDHVVTTGRAGDRDDDAFARLPGTGDAVGLAVFLERLVDPVGEPHQGELAQRAQVALAEVVGEGGVDLLRRVDVAVRHAPANGLGRHVDELDLRRPTAPTASGIVSCCLIPVICSTTSFIDSRCCTFTVEMTSIPASSSSSTSCQRFSLREPGTFVWASSSTSARSGCRAITASTSISSNVDPR